MKVQICTPAPTICALEDLKNDPRVISARPLKDPEFEALEVVLNITPDQLTAFLDDNEAMILTEAYEAIA